ncbi:MAG: lipoprotein intramolecular transacylase Lit [Anaerolineae bacterium]
MQRRFPRFPRVLGWLVAVLVPVALTLTAVRLLLTPAFLHLEYRTPGFPPDPYGFTLEDRLRWALPTLAYLLNDADLSFLAGLRLDDGSPLYLARELRHLEDTKRLVRSALRVWLGAWVALALLGAWARWGRWWGEFRRGLARGGWLTVALLGAVVLVTFGSFGPLFVLFHRVFFEGDTWLFAYSDSLIRLFPIRFWRDAFVLAGGLALVAALALAWGARPRPKGQ